MSINNLKEFEAYKACKSLCGLYLKKGEKDKLYEICIKYNIAITYPSLFENDTHYYLWCISENGIGLCGTIIMNYLSENNGIIIKSLEQLEKYLKEK